MKIEGTKNFKTRYEEIEFEVMLTCEKLKLLKELKMEDKELEVYHNFFKKLCEILDNRA